MPSSPISKRWMPGTNPEPRSFWTSSSRTRVRSCGAVPSRTMPSAIANSGSRPASRGRVLADEERGRAPARHLDREVVGERARPQRLVGEIVQRLEAVDHDEVGLALLDALGDRRERGLRVVGAERRAEVHDADPLVEQPRIEEPEPLHVPHELQRRLGERGEVQRSLPLAGRVEQHLEREDRLPGAGLARHDRDRLRRDAAAQDLVEPRHAGAHALEPERLAFTAHRSPPRRRGPPRPAPAPARAGARSRGR